MFFFDSEFVLDFFSLICEDNLKMTEEFCRSSRVCERSRTIFWSRTSSSSAKCPNLH